MKEIGSIRDCKMRRVRSRMNRGLHKLHLGQGKIPHHLLESLLAGITPVREALIRPKVGEDAFAVKTRETVIVASTDPITFTSREIGYYAVNINANDVVATGAVPRWFLATLLLPRRSSIKNLVRHFAEIDKACVEIGARLCGGHTEITEAVSQPVIVGTMLGTVSPEKLVRSQAARPGDVVLLTKRLAIEGTAIIARERHKELKEVLGKAGVARARGFLRNPGISVVREALCAVRLGGVHAMHDPTEGGLIWGVHELSHAMGRGIEIDLDRVPVYEDTRLVCEHFGLDPLGLIASGSLLIVSEPAYSMNIKRALTRRGIECTEIGTVRGKHVSYRRSGRKVVLRKQESDEITSLL